MTDWTHGHRCADCGTPWECFERPTRPTAKTWRCPVDVAARVNRQGPFCHWCRGLRELMAVADVRGWTSVELVFRKVGGKWVIETESKI